MGDKARIQGIGASGVKVMGVIGSALWAGKMILPQPYEKIAEITIVGLTGLFHYLANY